MNANIHINPLRYEQHPAPILTDQGARVDLIKNGYCPNCYLQLRKRKPFGVWKTIHKECPKCVMPGSTGAMQPLLTCNSATNQAFTAPEKPENNHTLAPATAIISPSAPPLHTIEYAVETNKKRFRDGRIGGDYVGGLDANGLRSGKGKMTWENGVVYEGEWKDDKMNGQGTYKFASGSVHEGEYKNGKRNGRGTYKFADGGVYEGEWKDSEMNGQGTFKYANGEVYEGEWKDGKADGQGTYKFVSGNVYEGEYKNGKRNGQGTYKYANGEVYEGEYKNDKRNGRGTYKYANGEVYEGEWKDDKRMGREPTICKW